LNEEWLKASERRASIAAFHSALQDQSLAHVSKMAVLGPAGKRAPLSAIVWAPVSGMALGRPD
jgi:hypothetical protein